MVRWARVGSGVVRDSKESGMEWTGTLSPVALRCGLLWLVGLSVRFGVVRAERPVRSGGAIGYGVAVSGCVRQDRVWFGVARPGVVR